MADMGIADSLGGQLDRTSPVPVFAQIRQRLVELIDSGKLRPHARLPSERQLSDVFGVSRMTVRQALGTMTNDRLLYSLHGKGTYVADQQIIEQPLQRLTSFTQDIRARGMRPSSRLVEAHTSRASFEMAHLFDLPPTTEIIEITRLRLANEEPLALETAHIPAHYAPGLLDRDLASGSLYELLVSTYGLTLIRARQMIEAGEPSADEIRLLEMDGPRPILRTSRVTYDATDRIIEFVRAVYRGDRYHMTVELR